MKKRNSLIIFILIYLFAVNVKADMGAPTVAKHKAMITNKNGAACYENDKKTDKVIPYGTTFEITDDIYGSYIYVSGNGYNCSIKYSDISAVSQNFSLDSEDVTKITPVKAVILAKGGLNLRKGPAVTYGKILTIPEHAVVTLTHKSGDYWYHCEYNGKTGWITGMNSYFGYDGKEVLVSYQEMKIYSSLDKKSVVGKIPANTEITNYINLLSEADYHITYYVVYNGVKGYAEPMMYKTDGTGKIKLIKDVDVLGTNKKMTANQELEYTMVDGNKFYFPEKKLEVNIAKDYFEYIKKADVLTKTKGYIGEGLFGEAKEEKKEEEEVKENESSEVSHETKKGEVTSISTRDIIIICLLAGIFLSLTAIVIIKLINNKKNKVVVKPKEENKVIEKPVVNTAPEKTEIEIARETIEKRVNSEQVQEKVNDEHKEV